jgi:mevalonate kinase
LRKTVKVSAPGKLMLFGEHAVVYGKPCVATAVDQRITLHAGLNQNNNLVIDAHDVGIRGYESDISKSGRSENPPKGARFIKQAVTNFYDLYNVFSGINIETKSEFSSEFGFGSSSAVTVATIAALSRLFDIDLSNKELFDLSYKTVIDLQRVGSGFDLAAAIWGGTLYFVSGGSVIESMKTRDLNFVIGYTGIKADTPTLVRRVAFFKDGNPELAEEIFNSIEKIVDKAKDNIRSGDVFELGKLMNENQRLLEKLGVSSRKLDNMIEAAKQAGAYGAKLSGAGGGDCMIALVPNENRHEIESAIESVGGKILKVNMKAEGLRFE